jgi:hypothetical protein
MFLVKRRIPCVKARAQNSCLNAKKATWNTVSRDLYGATWNNSQFQAHQGQHKPITSSAKFDVSNQFSHLSGCPSVMKYMHIKLE